MKIHKNPFTSTNIGHKTHS